MSKALAIVFALKILEIIIVYRQHKLLFQLQYTAHGLKPKVRYELNRTFGRFKEFKAHVRLSSVAHYWKVLQFAGKCQKPPYFGKAL